MSADNPGGIPANDPLARGVASSIRTGDVQRVKELLAANPGLAQAAIVDANGVGRSLLHVVTDWPGHFPNGAVMVALLIEAGSDPNAVVRIPGRADAETPLHWAASSDDVAVLEALLDGGADLEAPGAVFTGGTAMSDAVVFGQWKAARRLLQRGASTTLWQAAALGLTDRLGEAAPAEALTNALWHACHGGQREAAELLLARGADLNWIGYDRKTPLDIAEESEAPELPDWLRERGAKKAREV